MIDGKKSLNLCNSWLLLQLLDVLAADVLCGDRPAAPLLSLLSLLLCDGPRLDLPAAEDGVENSTADVDPSCYPEYLSPACQGVLTSRGEEDVVSSLFTLCTDCFTC